jgi:diguanylate cyclase (GGDEF)-like protein
MRRRPADKRRVTGDPDRKLRRAAAAGVAWLLAFAIATSLVGSEGAAYVAVHDGAYQLPLILCPVLLLLAARAAQGRMRHAWTILAVANLVLLMGELVWAGYEIRTGDVPDVSIADGFYLLAGVLAIPAVVLAFRSSGQAPGWRAALDASVLLAALAAGATVMFVAPELAGAMDLATLAKISYPVLDVLLLFTLVTQGYGAHHRIPRSVALIGASYSVIALTDASYAYFVAIRDVWWEQWLNVGYQAGAVLLCLAALTAVVRSEPPPRPAVVGRDLGLPLVLVGLAATVGLVLVDLTSGTLAVPVAIAAGYAVVAVSFRLLLTSREKDTAARRLHEALVEQGRLAITDTLTGLYNRRFAGETLRLETERTLRAGRSLGLLMVDLDHFKRVNDEHGHHTGDVVLIEAARRLAEAGRTGDVVARYGGEEFVIIVPECELSDLFEVGERVREAIGSRPIAAEGVPGGRWLTASVGGALLPEHAGAAQELLQVADRALYAAKAAGRNRVHLGPDREPALVTPLERPSAGL